MANTTDRDSENLAPPLEPEGGVTVACNSCGATASEGKVTVACSYCGGAIELQDGEKVIDVIERVNARLTRDLWYHESCFVPEPPRSEQLESQIGSQQGPWSSVELHKNSKGFTHDLKLYFPPEWSAADVETRLRELQGVIEKLESIGSEGRHAIE